jgi:ABC-type transporter Mla subunit MlaD
MIDRNRLTEHVNLSLFRLELRRAIKPLAVIAIGLIAAGAAGYYILNSINGGIGSTHTIQFEVADATGVVPGRAEVRLYGIQAGQVTNVSLAHGHAVLTASVANTFGPVYRNATSEVRPNTALQDMYLDIVDIGTPSAGVAGPNYVVPLSQTQSPVNLADVLNTFQPDVRTQLYNLLDQFGNGLADRGQDLREAFTLLAPFLRVAGTVSDQLALRASLTRQLVHNASILSSTLASRSAQLHRLITDSTSTLTALSTEGGAPLRQGLAMLPTLDESTGVLFTAFARAIPTIRQALTAVTPVADELPSGLGNLKAFAVSADPAVQKLQTPVAKLVPLADALAPFASNLSDALSQIRPQVSDVNTATSDLAPCMQGVDEFFNWDASMSKFSDSLGNMVRGNPLFGFYSIPITKQGNYAYGPHATCDGGKPIAGVPTPHYGGPAPAP